MNVFDIVGPIMVGPSSSHTAGAVRIGKMARVLLGVKPIEVIIKLHGSFAQTYKGHGTDKAIIGGLLGYEPDDLRISNSLEQAKAVGLKFEIQTVDLKDVHPNTAELHVVGINGKIIRVLGSSVGGGNIVIRAINGLEVEFTGKYYTLVVPHKDAPGAVASVTRTLAHQQINIAHMRVYRSIRGGKAMMVIETDQMVSQETANLIESMDGIASATIIEPI